MASYCYVCGRQLGIFDSRNLGQIEQILNGYMVCSHCYNVIYEVHYRAKSGFADEMLLNKYLDEIRPLFIDILTKVQDNNLKNVLKSWIVEATEKASEFEETQKQLFDEKMRPQDEGKSTVRKRNYLKDKGYDKAYEYKVISMVDSMNGRCDIINMENKLNELALEGWRVKSVVGNELGKNALSVMGMGVNSTVDELIFILEREYQLL